MTVQKAKPKAGTPRFDVAALREAAGDKVFARGQAYHADGAVELVAIEATRVLATVAGSEIYRTEMHGGGRRFSGSCSCPAFTDHGFCKHMVAIALAANVAAPDEGQRVRNRLARIREHLAAQGVDALVARIMDLAERDPALFRELEFAVAADESDDEALFARFRKAITDATRTSGFVDYDQAESWARGIDAVLAGLRGLVERGRAAVALRLLDHFFARMEAALGDVDDSDGYVGGAIAAACDLHLLACRAAKSDPVALARALFARELESSWDFFAGASAAYRDVLGRAGLDEYRRLALEAWQALEPRRGGERRRHDDQFSERHRLTTILDAFAERDGDIDLRIAIRARDLSAPHDYLAIAEFCRSHGRQDEALRWAEDGVFQFEHDPDARLVVFAADLHRRAGRHDAAEKLLWSAFERSPSLDLYAALRGGRGAAASIRERASGVLRDRLAKVAGRTAVRASSARDLLVRLLMRDALFAEAWQAAREHGADEALLAELAEASETSHPAEALAVHARRVDRLVGLGGEPNYDRACRLIDRMRRLRERSGERALHVAYVAELAIRHRARRNFTKRLAAPAASWSTG